jgi:hypothetical protein
VLPNSGGGVRSAEFSEKDSHHEEHEGGRSGIEDDEEDDDEDDGEGKQPPSPVGVLPHGALGERQCSEFRVRRSELSEGSRRDPSGLVIRRHPFTAGGTPTTTWRGCPGGSTWGIMGESKVVKPGQGGFEAI